MTFQQSTSAKDGSPFKVSLTLLSISILSNTFAPARKIESFAVSQLAMQNLGGRNLKTSIRKMNDHD